MKANINKTETIKAAYTENDHFTYSRNGNNFESTGCVRILDPADDDGDFLIDHGYFPEKGENDSNLYLPVQGAYEAMISWIRSAAKDGEI